MFAQPEPSVLFSHSLGTISRFATLPEPREGSIWMVAQIGSFHCPQIAQERWILAGIMMDSGEDELPHQFGEFLVCSEVAGFCPDAVYEKLSRRQAGPECDLARVSLTWVCL